MKKQMLILALIAFFASGLTLSSKAQINANYVGIWSGNSKGGNSYQLTLFSDWHCQLKVNGVTVTDLVSYRIYPASGGLAPKADEQIDASVKHAIKFYTQDALNGIFCSQNGNGSIGPPVEKTYVGFVTLNKTLNKMTLENIDFLLPPCTTGNGNVPTPISFVK